MRQTLAIAFLVVSGLALGLATVRIAPRLDARWHALDSSSVLFVPDSVSRDPSRAARIVLVLPGLGGVGRDLGDAFTDAAEANRWLLVAPSPVYDPLGGETLEYADLRVDNELLDLVDRATRRSPAPLTTGIGVVGFSRGAQQAHRFALRHSDRVTALASLSAGTYTMPNSQSPYPIGIGGFEQWDGGRPFDAAGLRRVNVLVGVGALDENPADVVRAWDAVGGTTRVERAVRFAHALTDLEVTVRFQLYPKTGHVFTPAMRDDAVALLRAT
ncbi:MAG TPA: alpha/beta hydrolase-fold protein [Candidatus Acidoferrales bacterium]|nr:alpha/beta hydrolase-fold protein [Candidatus Acidoferrales bacterium]